MDLHNTRSGDHDSELPNLSEEYKYGSYDYNRPYSDIESNDPEEHELVVGCTGMVMWYNPRTMENIQILDLKRRASHGNSENLLPILR